MDPEHVWHLKELRKHLELVRKDDLERANCIGNLEEDLQNLQLGPQLGDGGGSECSDDTSLVTLKKLPGRGLGLVATTLIPAGAIVSTETAVMCFSIREDGAVPAGFFTRLIRDFTNLPAATRQHVLSLHAFTRPDHEQAIRKFLTAGKGDAKLTKQQVDFIIYLNSICHTNSFEGPKSSRSSMYLKTSRINHSCLPNCGHTDMSENGQDKITIYACRDIQPGEEITVSYMNIYDARDKRRANSKRVWGFVCNCAACDYNNPTVDTTKHEKVLAEYRRLEQDSCLTISVNPCFIPLPVKAVDESLRRSVRRAEIAKTLNDKHDVLEETVLSAQICEAKWRLTGEERDVKRQIGYLEAALTLAQKIPFTNKGRSMRNEIEDKLRAAVWRQGDMGRATWAYLKKHGGFVNQGDKVFTARVALKAKLSGDTDPMDFVAGRIPLDHLPAELRALVVASGHSLEEILTVARDELSKGEWEDDDEES
ncbi:hypothetical protein diail_3538 [Diaporthe ilicicola]|nr:hypothetical protein diail_3538 [Diaporthe ilicicola]